ncbi:restriction modification system DNA specificity domain [Caldicellulosiruptor acetigenus I77R1B]|uniref:Restriction modification system DNA specificity domain n=1 Tax=Caldicellulosiruptor acetigenus (strain ATCC 700853 / DSM 12137 / I77R1B) TaxID=632335 RepID=E4SA97_CALA7|nr:restriction endonuclease subunit S [Caldicellulosiruptor acetigenus]ADQ40174.1 restriction modification system DNA specificity domain [Caldicellulosiruptor acetigenus I77R1B]
MKVDKRKLPEDWKGVELGEVLAYEQPNKYIVKDEQYDKSHGIPVLTPEKTFILGFTQEHQGIYNNIPVIIFDDFTTESRYIAFPFKLKSSAVKILKSKCNFVNLYYVYNSMQLLNFKPGSEHKRFWISEYSKFLIPFPPLPEQRKIAEILETIDNAIEKIDAIIEKYKRIKQGLMQDLLTKGVVSEGEGESERWRLRDENIDKFKDSPLGRIPEEWKIRKLDHREITIMITDGSHYSPQPVENSEYYIVNIENIINGKIEFETCKKISPKDYKKLVSNKCNPKYRDVLFTKDGTVGITLVFSGERNVVLLSSIAIIRPSNCLDSSYLKYSLETEQIKKQIDILIGGSVLKRIVLKDIKSLLIFIPPLPEQQRVASILSQIDEVIEKEQAYKEKLERIKKGLMEDLLTGKVRVNHLIEEE